MQSPLKGSVREVRGRIVKLLSVGEMSEAKLRVAVGADERFEVALRGLKQDGLVMKTTAKLHLTK